MSRRLTLSECAIKDMVRMYGSGRYTLKQLAKKFNKSFTVVHYHVRHSRPTFGKKACVYDDYT